METEGDCHSTKLSPLRRIRHDSPDSSPSRRTEEHCRDSPESSSPIKAPHDSAQLSPPRKRRHDSSDESPPRKGRLDSPDQSPPRRGFHDSSDQSPTRRRYHNSVHKSPARKGRHDSPDRSPPRRERWASPDIPQLKKGHHDSPDQSPPKKGRQSFPDLSRQRKDGHDSSDTSPPRRGQEASPDQLLSRKGRHDSPDLSPPSKGLRSSPDLSPPRKGRATTAGSSKFVNKNGKRTDKLLKSHNSPSHRKHSSSPDLSPPRNERHNSSTNMSPTRKKQIHMPPTRELPASSKRHKQRDDLPRLKGRRGHPGSDSDLSPPRKRGQSSVTRHGSDSDLSPPRRTLRNSSDSDLSPPRRATTTKGSPSRQRGETAQDNQMLSGGKAGLVVADVLRKEKLDSKRKERENKPLEEESRSAATVFRDKSGRKRDLQAEREEQQREAGVKSQKEEQYARWGQGLAQRQMQQQNVLDAAKEIEKPLARYIDDQDLDQMLREQERDGDPMANFIKKKKVKEEKNKKVRPRYSGPNPPPNRFDLWPGYRWDGVDRSNGFEQKRFARQADKKAVQEIAYKWSVEDM
ncbi:BUD13 homolog isoform X3 [Pleurodeles waltl]